MAGHVVASIGGNRSLMTTLSSLLRYMVGPAKCLFPAWTLVIAMISPLRIPEELNYRGPKPEGNQR
ncbi:MAG: hypothetical protein LBI92_06215, partial [Azoarcus sp.]|nr:hypothetical protein [Azoarcus sp.]